MYPFVPQTQSQVIISSAVLPHRSLFPLIRLSWNKSKTLIGALFTKVFSHLYNHSVSMFVNLCLKSFQKYSNVWVSYFFLFLKNFYFYFILLYNTVLVLPYIDMNPPRVYMWSQTWTPLPPPSPQHPSGSSPCTSPKHAVSCIGHRLVIRF